MVKRPTFGSWKPSRSVRTIAKTLKIPVAPKPKNHLEAATNRQRAIEAMGRRLCLSLTYDNLPRVVEVHTVGITRADRPAMSVYQVDGQSHEHPPTGWRLMCFDECFNVGLSELPSTAPRTDYRKGAKQFRRIDSEL